MPRRRRNMKGGFLDSLSSTLSSWGSSISQSASDAYNKAKSATTTYTSGSTSSYTPSSTTSYMPSYTSSSTYGGRKRSRKMRGGNIAATAAPISDIKTAQPHNWVGGKKTRKYRKH